MSERASQEPLRVVIAGGGTGGHLFPGLALAEELTARGAQVTFVGTSRGIEAKVVPQHGYPLELIDIAGLKRQGVAATLRSLVRLPAAAWQALRLLRRLRPQVVVGVGGYASGPVVMLAALRGTPTVVLEQNSIPGVTNRLLSRFARAVITAFPHAERFFPRGKVALLGNPIRRSVLREPAPVRPGGPVGPVRVLVLGGSQGARSVNELVVAAVEHWLKTPGAPPLAEVLSLRHQTGAADHEKVAARYRELGLPESVARAEPFITAMGEAYAACDLMVGRAGATTIAELTAVGRPALLIPFPQAADDHQTYNAGYLVERGAARLLVQAATTPAQLAALLQELGRNPQALERMAEASRALGRADAAAVIAGRVLELAGASNPTGA